MPRNKLKRSLAKINERLALHGGGVELVDFDDQENKVKLKLKGACQGCPMAKLTTENFIKKELLRQMPEIKEIKMIG